MTAEGRNDLPSYVVSGKILVPGGAFRKFHEFRTEGEKPRFFFVLNKYPRQDSVILLATASTQIKRLKQKWPADVLVEIGVYEYQELEYSSVINCEGARAFQRSEIERWITNGEVEPLGPLPAHILEKLRRAVAKCKVLAPVDKKLVIGEEDTEA